ncbi:hypothetical protein ACFYXM_00700 [Streptomyces sp. NPDC002476]|uniref:hypothetical protein n=1 Tax=Streptomyces sp. NPDC002476 TaxID=3364648 RepID=UPI00367B5181
MSDALDATLRLARARRALVKRFDATLGGLHGVSLADFTMLLRLGQVPQQPDAPGGTWPRRWGRPPPGCPGDWRRWSGSGW